jgi:endo-1,3-1,4-beta-glycanase ExoK
MNNQQNHAMKQYITTTLFSIFSLLFSSTASAENIPFFKPYPYINDKTWYISHGWSNGDHQSCEWRKDAITVVDNRLKLTLSDNSGSVRPIGCPEIHTNKRTGYGTYSVRMKTAAGSGLNTAFFTYVGPAVHEGDHSEIDFEFLGKNSKTVQLNYFDKGVPQDGKIIELGFDASADFHDYKFVWEPTKITWYVDGKFVHQTKAGAKIPDNPGRIYLSLWSGSKTVNDWLGEFNYTKPVSAEFEWVKYEPLNK